MTVNELMQALVEFPGELEVVSQHPDSGHPGVQIVKLHLQVLIKNGPNVVVLNQFED